jgi:hypothetical protein
VLSSQLLDGQGENMIKNFEEIKRQLNELSPVINSFKSEAVQLRIIELVFRAGKDEVSDSATGNGGESLAGRKKKPSGKRPGRAVKKSPENQTGKPKAKGRPGGKTTLSNLYAEGFFKKPKTIKQLVDHCELNMAIKYKQSDFSGALGRYVRDGKLTRTKNSEKQYEYSQK